MKVMTSPSLRWISARTALSRSSNSPRYFAPATIDAMSSAMRRLPRRDSGTSPATMRWARPSTTAVLPTPGSPMRTGLFFVRRDSTWTTRRISLSRPMTGSSLPSRATSVRSRPYLASASKDPSGSGLVRGSGRSWARAAARSPASTPPSVRMRPASLSEAAVAMRRCSVETYWSPAFAARSPASATTAMRAREVLGCVAAPSVRGRATRAFLVRAPIRARSAPVFSSREAAIPSGCSRSAASRWVGSTCGLPAAAADWSAEAMASCAFVVNSVLMLSPSDAPHPQCAPVCSGASC